MKFFLFHIVLTALYFFECDGLSVMTMVSDPTTAIIVPPDISSVTLSWNYTLDSGEQLAVINIERTRLSEDQRLVRYETSKPNDSGVTEQFKTRMNFSISEDKFHLIINNLVVDDGGFRYKCQVIIFTPGYNDVTANVILNVRVAAHNVVVVCGDAVLGQAMMCNCEAGGDPAPSFEWRASNGSFLRNGSSYTIPVVERTLNGNYFTCVASNGFGPDASNNTNSSDSGFSVKEKPRSVEISPHPSVTVNETGNTTLTCNASGGIPAVYHYKWQHNGKNISGGETGSLTQIDVQRNQGGNYSCQGCNGFGCAVNSTSLIVQYKPNSVHISPHPRVTVNEMDSTTLTCVASGGIPAVDLYKWQHNGNLISGGENGTLTLTDIQRNQTGDYSCLGCNTLGCMSNSTSLIVHYQPFNVSIVADPDSTVAAGKSLTLICTFDSGNLPASVKWKFNDAPMQQETSRTLVIKKVNVSDSGTYECTATNILGNATGKINITVIPKECGENPCSGNGNCTIQSDGVKKCKCKEGWHGENCNTCTCNSEGTDEGGCDVIYGQRICKCKEKYGGDLCELSSGEFVIVKGELVLTDYPFEAEMEKIDSKPAKKFIAIVRPLFQSGTSAKTCKITRLIKGSVKIQFELFFEQGKKGEEAVKKFVEGGKLGNYTIKKGSLVFKDPNISDNDGKSKLSTEAIIIIVVVVVALVIAIIALIMWRVHKDRCKRKRKVGIGEEHKLCERNLSNPNVGYHNSGLEHAPYVEDGPTVTAHQNERTKNGNNPNDLYAKVDMSKKTNKKKMPAETKKKKLGEVLYADLADFQPNVVTEDSKAQQPVKKPEKYQSTDYASITDIIKEREGKSIKVPIAASHIPKNGTTGTTKVVNGVGDGAVVAAEPVKDGETVKDPVEVPDPNIPNNGSTGATKVVNGVGDGTVVAPEPEKATASGTETVGDSSNLLNRKDDVEEGNQRKAEDILPQVA